MVKNDSKMVSNDSLTVPNDSQIRALDNSQFHGYIHETVGYLELWFGNHLGLSRSHLRQFWNHLLEPFGCNFVPFGNPQGPFWNHLVETLLESYGTIWGVIWDHLGPFGNHFEPFGTILDWLGTIWELSRSILDSFGTLESFGTIWESIGTIWE